MENSKNYFVVFMQFLFQKIWQFLLPIPMPWQAVLGLLLAMPLISLLTLRCLPWLTVKILQIVLWMTKLIALLLCYLEYQITQIIKKTNGKPPEILYILSDFPASGVRLVERLKKRAQDLSKTTFRIPWILRQKAWYALPLIVVPIWFLGPHPGFAQLTNSSAAWWCSLEHWIMAAEWRPSSLTCRYPSSSPSWDTFLKTREYELKRSIRQYTREIEARPNSPTAYYNRGNAYLALENIEVAFKDYTASVKLDPAYAPGYAGRGNIYLRKGNKSKALKEYSKATNADPKYAPGYAGRGNYYLAINDNSAAFKEYYAAINIDPEYAPGYVGRGNVYQKKRDKEAALQEYRKAIQINPNYGRAYARIGNLYYINFDDDRAAIKEYEKAADVFLENGEIDSYNEVINILNKLKKSYVLVSGKGKTKVTQLLLYKEACEAGKPGGFYSVENGVSGLLYLSECGKYGDDFAKYKFVDKSGPNRCKGSAELNYVGGKNNLTQTYWKIEEAVPGYECSTVGQEYSLQMYRAEKKLN